MEGLLGSGKGLGVCTSVMKSYRCFQLLCGKWAIWSERGGKEATSGTIALAWWEMAMAESGLTRQMTQILISPWSPWESISKLFLLHVVKRQKQILPKKIQPNQHRSALFQAMLKFRVSDKMTAYSFPLRYPWSFNSLGIWWEDGFELTGWTMS